MIYSAICLDNSSYFEKGTIKVRIFEYYSVPRRYYDPDAGRFKSTNVDDLSKKDSELTVGNAASLEDSGGGSADFEALIFAPLGGGRNYGMFALPKTNEKGIVAFLDGSFSTPIWMGSYFQPVRDENDYNKINFVNAPNEDPNTEGINSDLIKDGDSNTTLGDSLAGDQNTIILRTKTTTPGTGDDMNFEQQNSENIVALDSKKVRIRHFTGSEGNANEKYQEVMIYHDGDKENIILEVNNTANTKQSYIKINEDGINFYMNNNGDETKFELGIGESEESNSLYFEDKDGNTIMGDATGLFVNGDEDSIVLYSDLKDILEQLMEHIHIGSVPTKGPLSPKKAPLQYKKQVTDMEATLIKSKHD
jgi:hypothetical protein